MARKAAQAAAISAHRLNTGSTTGVRQDEDRMRGKRHHHDRHEGKAGERDPLPDGRI